MKNPDESQRLGEHLIAERLLSVCVTLFLTECALCEAAVAATPSQQPIPAKAIASGECFAADAIKDAWRKPHAVLEFMGVKSGMRVLGYVSGGGYYSELLARRVGPTGSVIVFNNRFYVQSAHGDATVTPTENPKLEPNSLDGVLFVMAYHDLYCAPKGVSTRKSSQLDRDLFAAVKPNGVLVVVDHVANPGTDPTEAAQTLQRIDPQAVKNDFTKAGFMFDGESTVLRRADDAHTRNASDPAIRFKTDQFVYRFRKPIS